MGKFSDALDSEKTKHELDCQKSLEDEWRRVREEALALEKDKLGIQNLRDTNEELNEEIKGYFEDLRTVKKRNMELEERSSELKTGIDLLRTQLQLAHDQTK